MDEARAQFLAGDRPGDVLMYFGADAVSGVDALAEAGERVAGGAVLVVDGDRGRDAFRKAVDVDPMTFAGEAMEREGTVAPDCTGGECPAAGDGGDHEVRFLLAFAEEETEAAGGRYAEGDVVHAYAQCSCGTAYSQRWVAGER